MERPLDPAPTEPIAGGEQRLAHRLRVRRRDRGPAGRAWGRGVHAPVEVDELCVAVEAHVPALRVDLLDLVDADDEASPPRQRDDERRRPAVGAEPDLLDNSSRTPRSEPHAEALAASKRLLVEVADTSLARLECPLVDLEHARGSSTTGRSSTAVRASPHL
ncbi:MAG TPA: hypothetical protein VHC45_03120 [Gaiellaceae bacterium]|nr:hypothetical protein [Gaiellaceae bacterium]